MARIELEIDDTKGEIVGDVPEAVKAILARVENTAHGAGFGKGAAKAAEEAKAQIAAAVAAEKAKIEAMAPLEREKYQRESEENKTLKQQMLEASRETDRTMKAREEAHATQLLERAEALKKRNAKIVDLTKAQLRGEARAAGARDESLAELEVILHSSVGYTDDMEPYVKAGDGTARTVQGKPMSIDAFVKEYLDGHSHHKRPAAGAGGGARGGASFHGHNTNVSADSARERVASGDRSPSAVNELFEATRKKPA
jgi:hypothetical protein